MIQKRRKTLIVSDRLHELATKSESIKNNLEALDPIIRDVIPTPKKNVLNLRIDLSKLEGFTQ